MTNLQDCLARVIRRDIQDMHAYAVQPSAGLVKLDAMENPFTLSPELQRELGERLGRVAINRYPAGRIDELRTALAAHAGLPAGCALTLGNGSDELITMLSMACSLPGATVMAPLPGFVMYGVSAQLQGLRFVGVPLTADFELDEAAMLAAIHAHRPSLLYLAYPNNPTANLAYQPFAAHDSMARLARHPHLLVMRTLSKFGLAGVRIGYLMGAAALVAEIEKARPPYNISVLNAEAALFALEHAEVYAEQAALIRSERDQLFRQLSDLPGVQPYPSQANMILARVPDAAAVFAGMKQRGVLVKNVSSLHPLLANCLRLTVGTSDENRLMFEALRASL